MRPDPLPVPDRHSPNEPGQVCGGGVDHRGGNPRSLLVNPVGQDCTVINHASR